MYVIMHLLFYAHVCTYRGCVGGRLGMFKYMQSGQNNSCHCPQNWLSFSLLLALICLFVQLFRGWGVAFVTQNYHLNKPFWQSLFN